MILSSIYVVFSIVFAVPATPSIIVATTDLFLLDDHCSKLSIRTGSKSENTKIL